MKKILLAIVLLAISHLVGQSLLGIEIGKPFPGAPEGFEHFQGNKYTGGKFVGDNIPLFSYEVDQNNNVKTTLISTDQDNFRGLMIKYNKYMNAISTKYSNADHVSDRTQQKGYKIGEGYELQGMSLGHLSVTDAWLDVNGVNIMLMIIPVSYDKGVVVLSYQCAKKEVIKTDDF